MAESDSWDAVKAAQGYLVWKIEKKQSHMNFASCLSFYLLFILWRRGMCNYSPLLISPSATLEMHGIPSFLPPPVVPAQSRGGSFSPKI